MVGLVTWVVGGNQGDCSKDSWPLLSLVKDLGAWYSEDGYLYVDAKVSIAWRSGSGKWQVDRTCHQHSAMVDTSETSPPQVPEVMWLKSIGVERSILLFVSDRYHTCINMTHHATRAAVSSNRYLSTGH